MKVTFLGTGPAINIPRKGCRCATCRHARKPKSKSKRLNSSILISHKGESILIDVTPNFKEQIKSAKIKNINSVLLTHAHEDAAGGIKDLIKWLKKNKTQTTLYVQRETLQKIKSEIRISKSETNSKFKNLQVKITKPYKSINLMNFKIVSFPVYHGLKKYPTFGYLINDKVIYASDMDGCPKKSLKYFRKAGILILDTSMWFGKYIKGHFNVEQAVEFAGKLVAPKRLREGGKLRKVYLTHVGHTFPPHQKAQKKINQYLRNERIPLKVKLAWDGMILNT